MLILFPVSTITGIIAMPWWKENFSTGWLDPENMKGIAPSQQAEIVSILSAGTFFGALGAAPFADNIGRRMTLICATAVFTFGVILQTVAMALPLFIAGRCVYPLGELRRVVWRFHRTQLLHPTLARVLTAVGYSRAWE